jgi:hypothetical protein
VFSSSSVQSCGLTITVPSHDPFCRTADWRHQCQERVDLAPPVDDPLGGVVVAELKLG